MNTRYIAQTTVEALDRGSYTNANGVRIEIASLLADCLDGTRRYDPMQLADLRAEVLARPAPATHTAVEVINETTLQGCARLVGSGQYARVGALNFASAKNPGGGFLNGAQAQEESLARSSGLYFSLRMCPSHYRFHRLLGTNVYSDRMIYSPACPVLRDDKGNWLDEPYSVDFITSPAPNAGAIQRNEPDKVTSVMSILTERSSKLLALAVYHGCEALVLGAWGCGVFRNDPRQVAAAFWEHLNPMGAYWGRFRKIVFSVLDKSPAQATYQAFIEQFAAMT